VGAESDLDNLLKVANLVYYNPNQEEAQEKKKES
jgi:hypothetical protein